MIKGIFIDAGHGLGPTGGMDNGASGNGTTERKEVVEAAQQLFAILMEDPDFSGIVLTKVSVDERLMLVDHIRQANAVCKAKGWEANDALLISIHMNAAGSPAARGIEAWYAPAEGTLDFARSLVEQICSTTGIPPRSTPVLPTSQNRWGRLGIIDDTIAKAVLIEAGFVTNEFDAGYLKNANVDRNIAEGIHRALRLHLGLPAVRSALPSPLPTPTPVPVPPGTLCDVPAQAWYKSDVDLCVREELFMQPSDGMFHPQRPVTRAELAAVMARHLRRHHGVS